MLGFFFLIHQHLYNWGILITCLPHVSAAGQSDARQELNCVRVETKVAHTALCRCIGPKLSNWKSPQLGAFNPVDYRPLSSELKVTELWPWDIYSTYIDYVPTGQKALDLQ